MRIGRGAFFAASACAWEREGNTVATASATDDGPRGLSALRRNVRNRDTKIDATAAAVILRSALTRLEKGQ